LALESLRSRRDSYYRSIAMLWLALDAFSGPEDDYRDWISSWFSSPPSKNIQEYSFNKAKAPFPPRRVK
jgi:hypothetical protein